MQVSSLVSFCVATAMAGLLVQSAWCQQQQPQEPENAPEPYSFSYNSESLGGMSSHQESGDGRGRVQGFYTIMGEDGRERRVDYVADENGYRASITTNEVGTRSESSADAQFNVQLPSQAQLDQAKVTAQEYEYLESTHAAERQRHLKQFDSNQQLQQQQAASAGSRWNQQQSDGNSQWNSQLTSFQNTNSARQQQSEAVVQSQRNWTAAEDEGWRRAKSLNLQAQPQSQLVSRAENQNRLQNEFAQPTAASSGPSALVSSATGNEYSTQTSTSQQGASSSSSQSESSSEASTPSGSYEQVPQRQQAQQAAWQMTSRGALPARRPVSVMQRQLEQQFMQQANQLTEQDYPRQPILQAPGYSAQQQQSSWSQANQFGFQRGQQQEQLRPAVNQQLVEQAEIPNQFQQQQNNIIDEVLGEQLEPMQPLVSANQQRQQEENFRYNNTAIKRPVVEQSVQQQFVPYTAPISTTTTTGAPIVFTTTTQAAFTPNTTNVQPTPSGFLSINLQDNTSEVGPNLDQEVDSRRPSSGSLQGFKQTERQTSVTGQVKGQLASDFQQVNYGQQPAQDFRPSSIKQIIEGQTQQQQQQQQQQQEEQRITTTTPDALIQPQTNPTKTSVFQPLITREPEPVTTKQTSEQYGTKLTSQTYDQSTTAGAPYSQEQQTSYGYSQSGADFSRGSNQTQEGQQLELATTRRPSYFNQQQQSAISSGQGAFFSQRQRGQNATKAAGTKGGEEYARTTTYIQPQPQTTVAQKQGPISVTYQPTRPTTFSGYVSTSTQAPLVEKQEVKTSSVFKQRQETTTRGPVVLDSGYQRQQADIATGSLELNSERQSAGKQQQQLVIETTTAPARPSFVGVDRNTQLQQQIQALRANSGVKGASSKVTGGQRKQFWQPLAVRQQQVQQAQQPPGGGRPSVDYANGAGSSSQSSGAFGSRILVGR